MCELYQMCYAPGKMYLLIVLILSFSTCIMAQNSNKERAAALFEKGEAALAAKEYFRAQAHYNECLRLEPRFAEAYRSRGIAREHLGEAAKALTDFNIYVDLKPNDADALFNRAMLRMDAKHFLPARQDFLRLLTMPPGETQTVYYRQEKHTDGTMKILTAPSNSKDQLYNFLGIIETELKRYPIAIAWLDSAIQLAPKTGNHWVNRGIARMHRGDKSGATADYEQALVLDPQNSVALHNLAVVKSLSGDTENAEKLLSESIEKNAKLPYPRAERGYQRLQQNDLKGALEDYNEVVRLEPGGDENYLNRGLVKEKLKDYDGALADFSKAIGLNEKNAKAWVSRGNMMSRLNRWTEAIEDYTKVIELNPKDGTAFYNRAVTKQNMKDQNGACEDFKKAVELGNKEAEPFAADCK